MRIHLDQFGGVMPKVSPHLLPVKMATVATNCRLGSGALESWKEPSSVATLTKAGTKKSIYHYAYSYWFHWLEEVDIVKAPVALDIYDRVYWTGEGYPKCGGNDIVLSGGGTMYPTASYRMGVKAPANYPNVVITGTVPEGVTPQARSYVFTYVNAYGGEGPPSPPSLVKDIANGQECTIEPPAESLTGYNITHKRIYRTETGSSTTAWMLVDTIDIGTATYVDSKLSEDLTTELPSMTWDSPPDDMKGLVAHPMGSLVGFSGQEVIFSEPYRPHAWPYRYAVSDPVVALGVYGSYVLVTTTGKPYIMTGSDPAAMTSERLEKGEACVSKRGMVDIGAVCIYPGASGLWAVGMQGIEMVTRDVLSLEDWQAYKPESIFGACYDNKYIGFYNNGIKAGGFIFDLADGDFTEIDIFATAAWNDPQSGELYLVVNGELNGNVALWNGGANPINYVWKSRPYLAPTPINIACAKVTASIYPVTFKIYADGVLKHTQTVADARPFWLPSGYRALEWYVEISGINTVQTVAVATSMRELDEQ